MDPHKSGRAAGFANRKPEHRGPGGYPYVLLLNAPGKPARAARDLINQGILDARVRTRAPEVGADLTVGQDMAIWWRAGYAARPDGDLSEVDWSQIHQALSAGRTPGEITAVLAEIADRKGKAATAYAERSVGAALRNRDSLPEP